MGLKAKYTTHELAFKKPATTSRGAYNSRQIHLIHLHNPGYPDIIGMGECAPLAGLSSDDSPDFEKHLAELVKRINKGKADDCNLTDFPSLKFGLETALLDLRNGGKRIIFKNLYSIGRMGIPINGLIWMSDPDSMKKEILEKINHGFECIKIK